jgi:predicted HicB family RNase H-like nuclease
MMKTPRANRERVGGRTAADTKTLTVRLDVDLIEALKKAAEAQGASVTSLVEALALSNRAVKETLHSVSTPKEKARMSTLT